jgi:hypothetical protein
LYKQEVEEKNIKNQDNFIKKIDKFRDEVREF